MRDEERDAMISETEDLLSLIPHPDTTAEGEDIELNKVGVFLSSVPFWWRGCLLFLLASNWLFLGLE